MRKNLKTIAERREAVIVPGVPNALFAKVVEQVGFKAVYVTGAGIANMHLGVPDIGLVTLTELVEITSLIADAVSIPVIVDADTGFGNPINVVRTVKLLERAGASAIQLEDQVFPKKCGHFSGKDVIPLDEMLDKIKAAVDTRTDVDLQIIARTDARAVHGLDAAIERAQEFAEVGADLTFVEAPTQEVELKRICHQISVPQVANIVFGGLTPEVPQPVLKEMGYSLVLYANAALQAALRATYEVMSALMADGSLRNVGNRLASFDERQRIVGKDKFDQLEQLYRTGRFKVS